jgi:hypothetical protein
MPLIRHCTFTFVAVISFIIDFRRQFSPPLMPRWLFDFAAPPPPWLMPLPPPAGRHAITLRHFDAVAIAVSMIRFHACRHFRHFAGIFSSRAAALFFHYFNYFLADAITAIYLRSPARHTPLRIFAMHFRCFHCRCSVACDFAAAADAFRFSLSPLMPLSPPQITFRQL